MCQEKIKKILRDKYNIVNNDPNFSLYPVVAKGKSKGKHMILWFINKINQFSLENSTSIIPLEVNQFP